MTIMTVSDLTFRPVALQDAARFAVLCNDETIARNTARISHPYARADAEKFLRYAQEAAARGKEAIFAVCCHGEIIACAGAMTTGLNKYEIGYWVGADYRRRGVATAAARAVTQFAFVELKAETATAGYFADNPSSGRVLERAGYKRTGEVVDLFSRGRGEDVETVRMELRRADFALSPDIVIAQSGA